MAWNPVARLSIILTHVANGSAPARSGEMLFPALVLVGFIAIAILRWIAGGTGATIRIQSHKKVDAKKTFHR
jgi:hypothetical protein